jgi:hypothetical protein
MTTTLEAPPDLGRYRGQGLLEVFDADKLRHAIARGKTRRFTTGDGSLRDGMRAVRLGQLSKRQVLAGARPSLWVPRDDLVAAGLGPDEVIDAGRNLFLTAGIARLWANFTAVPGATAVFDATHSRVGVGDGATAVTAADTDFTGSTNKYWQISDGAPVLASNTCKFTSTFPTGQGNFAWNKWGVDNGTASGATVTAPLFNAAAVALGTKTAAAAWAFSVTLLIA